VNLTPSTRRWAAAAVLTLGSLAMAAPAHAMGERGAPALFSPDRDQLDPNVQSGSDVATNDHGRTSMQTKDASVRMMEGFSSERASPAATPSRRRGPDYDQAPSLAVVANDLGPDNFQAKPVGN
jgi:hypothetical protein